MTPFVTPADMLSELRDENKQLVASMREVHDLSPTCTPLSAQPANQRSAHMTSTSKENDSLGVVEVQADKLRGPQTQRTLEHFSIGKDLTPREMITPYATVN